MIRPAERKPNPILLLGRSPLSALLLYVDHDGQIEERDGFKGEMIAEDDVVAISEGTLWVLDDAGDVVQIYPRGDRLSQSVLDSVKGQVGQHHSSIIVTDFESGILGASRAMGHATARVLTDLEAFQGLVTLSDEALDHAIGSNLKSTVSVRQHLENLAELEALVRSGGVLAGEIRDFLQKLKDPRDRKKRHNVYRMVLIVRAVQRRAKDIAEGKGDTLAAITVIGLDVARYVGAVTATAAQIRTELSDVQPWWTGTDPNLTTAQEKRRRANFVTRLRQYRTELLAVTAKPFRCWTFAAANRLENMASSMEQGLYAGVLTNARSIVALMEAILVREGISRCIIGSLRGGNEDDKLRAANLLGDVSFWYLTHAETLRLEDRGRPMYNRIFRVGGNGSLWQELEDAAREVERHFDELML